MRGVRFADMHCSVARTLDIVGERWTLLILRDAFNGIRRFDDFLHSLGIARNILTDRLQTLVAHGILERRRYQERPPRYEYRLTAKGLDLFPVLTALTQWGDRYLAGEAGPPFLITHKTCGHEAVAAVLCPACGEQLSARDARRIPGSRAPAGADNADRHTAA